MSTRSPQSPRPNDRCGFEIAIICALPLEADAIEALFDHHWDDDGPPFDKALGDPNAYSTGVIGRHNVILAYMPGIGKANAAAVASNCRESFPGIKLALVVGICGVVPFSPSKDEIVLGDVIISDSIIQYDFGRQLPNRFIRKDTISDSLGRPNQEIRGIIAKLRSLRNRQQLSTRMAGYLNVLYQKPELHAKYPGSACDKLFKASYCHTEGQQWCEQLECNGDLVPRGRLENTGTDPMPTIHFGLIASGDSVMKSGEDRDRMAADGGIIAFEMEGAGVWDNLPCIVIKGACDYADSHKSKIWQPYAAATAAACTKAFLSFWVPSASSEQKIAAQVEPNMERVKGTSSPLRYYSNLPYSFAEKPTFGRTELLDSIANGLKSDGFAQYVGLYGLGGVGKSHVAFEFASKFGNGTDHLINSPTKHTFWLNAGDQSQLDKSCLEICKKIGLQVLDNPLITLKSWMEDSSNGAWILVVDGLNQMKHASSWFYDLPRCRLGRTIITTKQRECLEKFTELRHETTISVKGLSFQSSRKLFDSVIGDLGETVSDDEFGELLRLVKTPLFVKLSASYLLRYREGRASLRGLIDKLSRLGIASLHGCKTSNTTVTPDTKHELLYKTFSVLFSPFVDFFQPDDEEFLLLGIISCFSHISLDFKTLAGFYKSEQKLREYLGTYGNYCFVERDAGDQYSMHDLVASSFIEYVHKNPYLGPCRVLDYYGWMLERILDLYDKDKKKQAAKNEHIQRDSYIWKAEYMPHFERFLDYVSDLRREDPERRLLGEWKFRSNAARSIVTFTRPLASDNRIDEAISLLRFVVDQGVANDGRDREDAKSRVIVMLELAKNLEGRPSGRNQGQYLIEAKSYAELALQICEESSLTDLRWDVATKLIDILGKLELFDDAYRHTETLQAFLTHQKDLIALERIKLEIRLDEQRAMLTFRHGLAHGRKSRVIEAKKALEALVSRLQNELPGEKELITDVRRKLAAVNIEIPLGGPLNDAEKLYHDVLQRVRGRYADKPDHPGLARAYLNLAIVWLRKNQILRAKKALAQLYQSLVQMHSLEDGLTRDVAYNYRLSLRLAGDEMAADEVDAQFARYKPLKNMGMGQWFDNDADPETEWPAEWDVPVRHEALERYMESPDTIYARIGLLADPLVCVLKRRRPSPQPLPLNFDVD